MVRAGISLPALQQLMGHSQIRTTMLYVQLAPQDVWREYARAVQNRIRLSSPQNRMTPFPSLPDYPARNSRRSLTPASGLLAYPHRNYQAAAHRFLAYLQTDFPQVLQLSQLRRDPHLLGWLRSLGQQDPSLSNEHSPDISGLLRRLLG